jgi:transposase
MTKQAQSKQQKQVIVNAIRQGKRNNPKSRIVDLCESHGIKKSTYYLWCRQEMDGGLEPKSRKPKKCGNQINSELKQQIVKIWEEDSDRNSHEIYEFLIEVGIKISYNTVNDLLKNYRYE